MSHTAAHPPSQNHSGLMALYHRTPLYLRIVISLLIGAVVGHFMGPQAALFKPFSDIVLRLLQALATPLIFVAVVHALLRARVTSRVAGRMTWLLLSNTVVAIVVGLAVANVIQPGRHAHFTPEGPDLTQKPFDIVSDLLGKIPGSLTKPFVENDILAIILIAIAMGIALRKVRAAQEAEGRTTFRVVEDLLETAFSMIMVILHWVIDLVPLAVFGVVARVVGTTGFQAFQSLGWFVVAVLTALALQSIFYMVRLRLGSWVRPGAFLRGGSDALLTAFSTASSAATMPITYNCMRQKVGVREEAASMGILVGGTFNHDGTALYEAMAALFISQVIGAPLGWEHQVLVVLMAVVASVGAAGIPEAGLVTMMAVFTAVKLPVHYIPLLLTVDWFLDRARTAINVMGDMTVTCILDGKTPAASVEREEGVTVQREEERGERQEGTPSAVSAEPTKREGEEEPAPVTG